MSIGINTGISNISKELSSAVYVGKMDSKNGLKLTEEAKGRQVAKKPTTVKIDNGSQLFVNSLGSGLYSDNYLIGDISFSKKEVLDIHNILKNSFLPVENEWAESPEYFDYSDYAKMGITESAVAKYCEENLSEEQGKIVKDCLAAHFDKMIEKQNTLLDTNEYKTAEEIGFPENKYYNVWHGGVTTDAMKELLEEYHKVLRKAASRNGMKFEEKEEFPNADKDNPDISWGSVQWATDKETTSYIRKLFAKMDITDEDAVGETLGKYKEKIEKVYSYQSRVDVGAAGYDISDFVKQIANDAAVVKGLLGDRVNKMV